MILLFSFLVLLFFLRIVIIGWSASLYVYFPVALYFWLCLVSQYYVYCFTASNMGISSSSSLHLMSSLVPLICFVGRDIHSTVNLSLPSNVCGILCELSSLFARLIFARFIKYWHIFSKQNFVSLYVVIMEIHYGNLSVAIINDSSQ